MLAIELFLVTVGLAIVMANRGRRGITFVISILFFAIGFAASSTMLLSYGAALMLFGSIEGVFAAHQSRLRHLTLGLLSLSLLSVFLGYTAFLSRRATAVQPSGESPFVTSNKRTKLSVPIVEDFVPISESYRHIDTMRVNIDVWLKHACESLY